ncbi:mismatch repair protein PMS1 [Trypanosoma grayi]|uniref:mismatch repair protein PMS1 n=1 Tax=Trypanosoma grayi TaxID=71804 RepID=UPI0004F432DA|nr:mismatch repair protein PMS1 [Trypanosoma grayi]KEG13715.1 mismatch repair protein PMS1 [Trypanosoma grayi]
MITRLDAASARKLSAGQVITDLSSVLKELVENSLDAGAHTVTIRIDNYGLDKIVVHDDGGGLAVGELLNSDGTLKDGVVVPLLACRATTKHQLEDNRAVAQVRDSLGFRGEALHCLANLSEVTIHTMTTESQSATITIAYESRSHHTSLRATQERKSPGTTVVVEKLFSVLPVRHGEFNKKKKKQLLAATSLMKQYALSHPHVRLLMTHHLNAQSAPSTLVSLTGTNDIHRALAEAYGGRYLADMRRVEWNLSFGTLTGFVSKGNGGRFSADLQVLALDGRLVDLPMISKAISDAYAECQPNAAQRLYPVIFLHLTSGDSVLYDVNLAPNKRKVLLTEEDKHAEEVRSRALHEFRASTDSIDVDRRTRIEQTQLNDWRATQLTKLTRTPVSATSLTQFTFQRAEPALSLSSPDGLASSTAELSKMCSSLYQSRIAETTSSLTGTNPSTSSNDSSSSASSQGSLADDASDRDSIPMTRARKRERIVDSSEPVTQSLESKDENEDDTASTVFLTDETNQQRPAGPRTSMQFPPLKELMQQPLIHAAVPVQKERKQRGTFARITEQTEEELATHLNKGSFKDMILHGQFNHGFIMASFKDDMFVIDQHAADEKFNYECLMNQYKARPQPLVVAVPVPMDPQDVDLAIHHSNVLRQHGFIVKRSEDANKLLVLSVPVLQYEVVGPHDVMELVQQLALYGTINKPMRSVWHSMATKACRSSIMIGTVLTEKTMRSVVSRLSELEQPWNCPHGRPTLRHVARISSFMVAGEADLSM